MIGQLFAGLGKYVSEKDEKPHDREVIEIKQELRFLKVHEHKFVLQQHIRRQIPLEERIQAVDRDDQTGKKKRG